MRKTERRIHVSDAAFAHAPKPAFEPNAFYERVIVLRRTDARAFDSLAPITKIALGHYEAQKREAERLQAIRDEAT
ncbi:MAG: hypothetical protein M3430_14165 [Acidobacteriota bacterium]|nr:hypothetical protein [Acidobacteriota bacterium]